MSAGVGLTLLLIGAGLAVVLDLPGGPTGWRDGGSGRWALIGVTAAVQIAAIVATWVRLHP